MTNHKNSRMRWFADDFDYRANSDDCPELMSNVGYADTLPPLTRMLVESNEFFVQIEDNKVKRVVRQRHGESVPWLDPDDMDEDEKQLREEAAEDAMNYVPRDEDAKSEDKEAMVPSGKWDLVFWTEMRSRPVKWNENGKVVKKEWVKVEASSPVFPQLRDKRLRGYACNLEKAIGNGIGGRRLYKAIQDALGRGDISKSQAARLFEIYKIAKFLNKKGE